MMYPKIFARLSNTAEYAIIGNPTTKAEYDRDVTWLSDDPKPTWEQIVEVRKTIENEEATEQIQTNRRNAYFVEADPLFFGWQRGENTEQAWLEKVAEIRARYPYPA